MRDDLIGFVLGALDPDEQDTIRRRVEQDQELQRRVAGVERCLQPLAAFRDAIEPPAGLAQRACHAVYWVARGELTDADRNDADPNAVDQKSRDQKSRDQKSRDRSGGTVGLAPQDERAGQAAWQADPLLTPRGGPSSWGADQSGGAAELRHWTTADFVVAAGVCLAMACLFFPALSNSRYNMQLASCQNNMRKLSQSFDDYSRVAGGYFPVVPPSGNLSFSGVYAPKLAAKGLVGDGRVFLCPAKGSMVVLKFPPLQDIAAAKGPQLVSLHHNLGGDYAYALPYLRQGHLYGIRNEGRWNVAVLADAPLENLRNSVITTHSRGQNVLFSDGHVRLVGTRWRPGAKGDDLFQNDRGLVRAGLHSEDFVLAPSHVSPLPTLEDDAEMATVTR